MDKSNSLLAHMTHREPFLLELDLRFGSSPSGPVSTVSVSSALLPGSLQASHPNKSRNTSCLCGTRTSRGPGPEPGPGPISRNPKFNISVGIIKKSQFMGQY